MKYVWLLYDGDSGDVLGVYTSEKLVELAKVRFEPYWDHNGKRHVRSCSIEKWPLDWDKFDMAVPPSEAVKISRGKA